jgi:hypothetical protein
VKLELLKSTFPDESQNERLVKVTLSAPVIFTLPEMLDVVEVISPDVETFSVPSTFILEEVKDPASGKSKVPPLSMSKFVIVTVPAVVVDCNVP